MEPTPGLIRIRKPKKMQCPKCRHKWLDKYRKDECPRCLTRLSEASAFAVCAPFGVWQTGRAEAFRRGRGQRSSGGRVVQYGGSTPRPPPTLCHPIPALHPLTPPLRTGREHAHHVRSINSHTLISAMVHPSSGRIAAQLAGRLGAARVAAPMATTASRVDAASGLLPALPSTAVSMHSPSLHAAHSTLHYISGPAWCGCPRGLWPEGSGGSIPPWAPTLGCRDPLPNPHPHPHLIAV